MAKSSKKPSRDVAVGAMFAMALIVLAIVIMALGDGSNLFRNQVGYVVVFPTVEGMGVGSPLAPDPATMSDRIDSCFARCWTIQFSKRV